MEEQFVTYMRNLAINCKDILHTDQDKRFFHIRSIFEGDLIITNIKSLTADVIMVVESPEGNLSDNDGDNPFEIKRAAFILLKKLKTSDLSHEPLYDGLMKVAKKIIGRMRKDRRDNVIHHFKVDIDYSKIGPIAENRYGYRFEFEWGMSTSAIVFNENDWLN